ncbi:hypothetical protein E3V39_08430 [Gammaproteobacteria bacterium LSUCC0112]|nr:hypothetical protein E3V39_08430 [Gammaproteobacteria bacterium LSUCC0112]
MLQRFNAVCFTKPAGQIQRWWLSFARGLSAGLLMAASATVYAQTDAAVATASERAAIEIIAVQNRDPAFVRAAIRPILDPRGSIAQVDNKLIVATTASNLQQIKRLIEQTDLPARRLVVSVDFDHQGAQVRSTPSLMSAQQSVQSLEGNTVVFSELPDTAGVPQLSVKASIQSSLADTEIVISNVPGFTGQHRLQLPLGEWYIINPEPSPDDELASLLDSASADIPEQADVSPLDSLVSPFEALIPPARQAPIAIRVDVLP